MKENMMPHMDRQRSKAMLSAAESSLICSSEAALRVPCYCEENVWRLAYRRLHTEKNKNHNIPNVDSSSSYHVVFISNEIRCVPMFHQRARDNPDEACFWDYHVVLLRSSSNHGTSTENNGSTTEILDMDSNLDYPSPLNKYLDASFAVDFTIEQNEKYAPLFRVIQATEFLESFCSDRMHMYDKATRTWNSPPPDYECITTRGSNGSNLQEFISMKIPTSDGEGTSSKKNGEMGTVMTLEQLQERFGDTK